MIDTLAVITVTLNSPVSGYWDGGAKRLFDCHVHAPTKMEGGYSFRLDCFDGNWWETNPCGVTKPFTTAQVLARAYSIVRANVSHRNDVKSVIIEPFTPEGVAWVNKRFPQGIEMRVAVKP